MSVPLPDSWQLLKIADIAQVNPRRPSELLKLPSDYKVTFVPMPSVCEHQGAITEPIEKPCAEVRKGFTYFAENDVIFAKITPCMQNGKAAIARDLTNELGFGSTEFHVLRAGAKVIPEWLYYFVRQKSFRDEAQANFRGSAGQQRVPADFLAEHLIPVPSAEEQSRIVNRIKECLTRVDEIKSLRIQARDEAKALEASLLHERFSELQQRYGCKPLGELSDIKGGSSLPRGVACNDDTSKTLLVKVGDMNLPGNEVFISTARECLSEQITGACPIGAVVFPKRGGAISTNKKRLLAKSALLDPNLMGIIANEDLISGKFLYYWFLTFNLSKLISGSTVPQLNRKDLAPLEIPLPPKDVQEHIVSELDALCDAAKSLRNEVAGTGDEVDHLASSILRKAFAGEL